MASTKVWVCYILRIVTILFAVASVVVLILNKVTDKADNNIKITFKDVTAYRYVLAMDVIAAIYCLVQLVIAMRYTGTEKSRDFLEASEYYGDKVIAVALATAIAAGFFVTLGLRDFLAALYQKFHYDLDDTVFESFFNKGYQATGFLTGAFFCMALLSFVSYLHRIIDTEPTPRQPPPSNIGVFDEI